jgi:hypothetical protein
MSEENIKQAVTELDTLNGGDAEASHWQADDVLIHYLEKTGGKEVANAWVRARDRIGFWYA